MWGTSKVAEMPFVGERRSDVGVEGSSMIELLWRGERPFSGAKGPFGGLMRLFGGVRRNLEDSGAFGEVREPLAA